MDTWVSFSIWPTGSALRTEPTVAFAMLFGSVARGDDDTDSDVAI